MKKHEIKVGGHYLAKVNGVIVTVRVDQIEENQSWSGRNGSMIYDVTNLKTGRKTTFRSAAKFRSEVGPDESERAFNAADQQSQVEEGLVEGEQSSDPMTVQSVSEQVRIGHTPKMTARQNVGGSITGSETTSDFCRQEEFDCGGDPGDLCPGCGKVIGPDPCHEDIVEEVIKAHTQQELERGEEDSSDPTKSAEDVGGTSNQLDTAQTAVNVRSQTLVDRLAAKHPQQQKQPVKHDVKPTEEQQAIIDLAKTLGRGDILVIQAGAGTGKTSSLKMLEQELGGQGQYTAFNRSLVDESKTKFKKAKCNSTHSLAFREVGHRYAHRLNGHRVRASQVALILGIESFSVEVPGPEPEGGKVEKKLSYAVLASYVTRAISRFCQSADKEIEAKHFRYIDGIDTDRQSPENNRRVREYLLPFAEKAWEDLQIYNSDPEKGPVGKLPFSHDHYVKLWQLSNPLIPADYILLDEAQDTAPVFLDIIRQQKCLKILVGDSAQQIYSWRGAVNAMTYFENASELYLSQSFRFGEAIADLANQVLAMLPGTKLRLKGLPSTPSRIVPVENPKAILCRTNAGAISHLLAEIGKGRKPALIGKIDEIVSLVKAAKELQEGKGTSHPELACFTNWNEVKEYTKLDEGEDLKLMVKIIDEFGCDTILNALNRMPEEKHADVVISTAHKSKGREWDTVVLSGDFPTADKCCDEDLRLIYVALTRAKLKLDIFSCPFFQDQEGGIRFRIKNPSDDSNGAGLPLNNPVPPALPKPTFPVDQFTWSKGNDGWLIRGRTGMKGKRVSVVRKNGGSSNETLGEVVRNEGDVAFYHLSK